MRLLEIRERSYYYFKKKLYKQSLELQTANKTNEVIAFETRVLKERLMKVYQHLEERLSMMNREPRIDDNMADLAIATYQIAKNIMQLELEGLRALSCTYENKFLRNANRTYQDYYGTNNNNNNSGGNGSTNTNILQP